ncbi:hypothetical protein GCM10007939_13180 [Amylibacter marinus]|uniref:HPr kinase/phosphorylase C-terminal domain-containing protein n=1 Tax=Amylibacter marinus TaxID=1475483 RepID=A0ABQ5VUT7_9RHOB|nr:serine kinase [Amylibacter marinus]GLQ35035.1 hypothetical protein GCM10007939_13180 [Amylibacter marinus]
MILTRGHMHASGICFGNFGVLISGASGQGKSHLALACMGVGAGLICDDMVEIDSHGTDIMISPPQTAIAKIEVRGVGLIDARLSGPRPLQLVVDLDQEEPERLPKKHHAVFKQLRVRLIHAKNIPHLHYVIKQLAIGGTPQG